MSNYNDDGIDDFAWHGSADAYQRFHDDEPSESDRATCTICGGAGCHYCLMTGVEQTREDFERHDDQADGSLDLRLTQHDDEDAA